MQNHLRIRHLVAATIVCLLATTACTDQNEPPENGGGDGQTTVSSIPIDGFLLVSLGPDSIAVFDTASGATSPSYPAVSAGAAAVSPDGQRVAFGTINGITIARVAVDGNRPALISELEVANGEIGGGFRSTLRWTPDGEQVVYNDGVIDAATGETFRCEPRDPLRVRYATLIPGGHDVVCNTDRSLRRDGEIRASLADGIVSADGQFLNVGTHVPTAAQPIDDKIVLFGGDTTLPTGEFATFTPGVHGNFVVSEAAGFVTLYRVETNLAPAAAGSIRNTGGEVGAVSGATTPAPPGTWRVSAALNEFFTDGEGRRYAAIGNTPDGERVIYVVRSHVISSDSFSNALSEQSVEGALVAIAKDGSARGFRVSPFGLTSLSLAGLPEADERQDLIPEHLKPFLAVDLGEEDQIVPTSFGVDGRPDSWAGWMNGEPWVRTDIGTMSPDGRYFAGSPTFDQICVTERDPSERTRCMESPFEYPAVRVLDFVGYDLKPDYQTDAPRILATSRVAAYDGGSVAIFGTRFGQSGTLRVGDVEVPASAITEWSDRRITFTMSAELPDSGAIEVTTGTGSTEGQRRFWLHHTTYVGNVFDDVPNERVTLSQGFNPIDLGPLDDFQFEVPFGVPLLTSPNFFTDDGQLYLYAGGSPITVDGRATLIAGGKSRQFIYTLSEELAEPARWQPVFQQNRGFDTRTMFASLLGGLANVGRTGLFVQADGSRVDVGSRNSDNKSPHIRVMSDGTGLWRIRASRASEPRLWRQTGWQTIESSGEVRAVFSDDVTVLRFGLQYVEDAGDVVLITGTTTQGASYALSTDGGQTFGETITVSTSGNELREPIRVEADQGTFFLVMSSPSSGPGLLGVHAIALDGTFTEDFAAIPAGDLSGGLVSDELPVSFARRGGELVLFFPLTNTLVYADFDTTLGPGEAHTWTTLPASTDEGKVVSMYHEEGADEVYAVLDDGTVMRATSDWTEWEVWDMGFDLALPTTVVPRAIGRLADGRWIVDAALYDAREGAAAETPSPLREEAYLVSPAP